MESRAGSLLRKAMIIIFGSTPIIARLLHGPASPHTDLESQSAPRQPKTPDYNSSGSPCRQSYELDEVDLLGANPF